MNERSGALPGGELGMSALPGSDVGNLEPLDAKVAAVLCIILVPAIVAASSGFGASADQLIQVSEEGTLASRLLYSVILFVSAFFAIRFKMRFFWSRIALVYAFFLCFGVCYSTYPLMVIRGAFVALSTMLMWNVSAQYLVSKGDLITERIAIILPVEVCVVGLVELVFWALSPRVTEYGYMADYVGYFFQPNLLAKLLCVGILFVFYSNSILRASRLRKTAAVVLFGLLISTGSRTSLIALFIAIAVVFLFDGSRKLHSKIQFVALAGVIVIFGWDFIVSFFSKGDEFGILSQSTLTFRVDMWTTLLPYMFEHPLFGAGLNAFWNAELFQSLDFGVAGIHNGYLQVFQDLGIIGLVLLGAVTFQLLRPLRRAKGREHVTAFRRAVFSSWVYFFVVNFTEGDLGNFRSSLWGLLMTLSLVSYYIAIRHDATTTN